MLDAPDTATDHAPNPTPDPIEWTYDIPLLTSRFMVWDFVRVILISVVAMGVIVALGGLIIEGELIILPPMVYVLTAGILAGLFVLTSLLLGNRMGARFTVDARGAGYRAEKRERSMNKLVLIVGLLARNPTTAGAGALAMSSERTLIPWKSIHRVVVHRRERVIALHNSWRTVLRIHCPPELFDEVASAVETYHRAAIESTPPRY